MVIKVLLTICEIKGPAPCVNPVREELPIRIEWNLNMKSKKHARRENPAERALQQCCTFEDSSRGHAF